MDVSAENFFYFFIKVKIYLYKKNIPADMSAGIIISILKKLNWEFTRHQIKKMPADIYRVYVPADNQNKQKNWLILNFFEKFWNFLLKLREYITLEVIRKQSKSAFINLKI